MTLSQQCVSLDLAKRLKELGVEQARLKIAHDILTCDAAHDADMVLLEASEGKQVSAREKNLANLLINLYRVIHPHFCGYHPQNRVALEPSKTNDTCDICGEAMGDVRAASPSLDGPRKFCLKHKL